VRGLPITILGTPEGTINKDFTIDNFQVVREGILVLVNTKVEPTKILN
jgi:hypothetical protein